MTDSIRTQRTRPPSRMLREVARGLAGPQKELPPKYFYDARGSALFDEITRLPEYYLTRTERALLDSFARGWIRGLNPSSLVELGAGSGDKTRILLDALRDGAWYVPVDLSETYLQAVAAELGAEYPDLVVVPSRSDMGIGLDLPADLPRPTVLAFLGSTIGNFDPPSAVRLLRRVRAKMRAQDRFLLGADLRKDEATLNAAYNDARGLTAEFNLNILRVLNRELGADFDLAAYRHHAFYDADAGRIEMHLVAREPQSVRIPGARRFRIAEGETIRTEISCKYDRRTIERLFGRAGLEIERWVTDERARYALVVARIAGAAV